MKNLKICFKILVTAIVTLVGIIMVKVLSLMVRLINWMWGTRPSQAKGLEAMVAFMLADWLASAGRG
jgi:hypothetical protein